MAGEFKLPNETIEIKYIKKQKGLITDPRHIAYGGLLEGAYITLPPKKLRNGQFANVLTNEEKTVLENMLGFEPNSQGLSIYKKEDNYWNGLKIRIGKEGLFLQLNEPVEYIRFKVLESYDDLVASHISKVEEKQTYRFVIIRKDDEAKQALKKVDIVKEAYKQFGKLEDNKEAMINFLRVTGLKVDEGISLDWLNAEVSKMLTEDPKKFVTILKDTSYSTRVLLYKAIAKGEVIKKGQQYLSKDGELLAEPNQLATIDNVISYLESNVNQEYRLLLMSKV
jgi:hypothetical protein